MGGSLGMIAAVICGVGGLWGGGAQRGTVEWGLTSQQQAPISGAFLSAFFFLFLPPHTSTYGSLMFKSIPMEIHGFFRLMWL